MTVLYRSGGLPTVEELCNSNAVWFDSVSERFLSAGSGHVPRCDSVFMSFMPEDALVWAERRIVQGLDGTVFEVTVPDDLGDSLYAYRYGFYDDAHRAFDYPDYWGGGDAEDFSRFVSAYWLSGRTVSHWLRMWMSCHEDYDDSSAWEVKVPLGVAAAGQWVEFQGHDELVDMLNLSSLLEDLAVERKEEVGYVC